MDLRRRWVQLMDEDFGRPRLGDAMALIAVARRPELDPDELLGRLDDLAEGCTDATAEGVRTWLFHELGFCGDRDEYHHENNSLLDQVLERRRGLPIALSVLYHEVARRVGVDVEVIAIPGHVIVRDPRTDCFIDGFNRGALLSRVDCAELFRQVNGPRSRLQPKMLDASPPEAIVARMLSNLVTRYLADHDWRNAKWALEMRSLVPGWPAEENADLATVLVHLGAIDEAARVWTRSPSGPKPIVPTRRAR